MIILTFSDSEDQVVEKIKEIVEKHETECVHDENRKEITFGDIEIHANHRKVICKGTEVELTSREFEVLYTLAYNQDQVLTTRQIYRAITGEDATDDYHGMESSIYSIKKETGT